MAYVIQLLERARGRLVSVLMTVPLFDVAKLLHAGTDIVVVCDHQGRCLGVITKSDVVERVASPAGIDHTAPVASAMQRDVVICGVQDELHAIWAKMRSRDIKNVPVLDAERHPIGILNARDALDLMLNETENEEALLRDYVMGLGYR